MTEHASVPPSKYSADELLAALKVVGIEPPENDGEPWTITTEDGPEPAGDTLAETLEVFIEFIERTVDVLAIPAKEKPPTFKVCPRCGIWVSAPVTGCASCGFTLGVRDAAPPKEG